MNATSSRAASSANALWRSDTSSISVDHSIRMHGASAGTVAPQAAPIAARTMGAAPARAARTSAINEIGFATAAVARTRVWPTRSINRPWAGRAIAPATATAASTSPAMANEPVSPRTRRIVASDTPAIGSRPIVSPTSGTRSARIASRRLYGEGITVTFLR